MVPNREASARRHSQLCHIFIYDLFNHFFQSSLSFWVLGKTIRHVWSELTILDRCCFSPTQFLFQLMPYGGRWLIYWKDSLLFLECYSKSLSSLLLSRSKLSVVPSIIYNILIINGESQIKAEIRAIYRKMHRQS